MMDDDWKEWDGVGTVASTHVPQFLLGDWETAEEYEQQTNALVAKHWNQFRAILTNEKANSEAQGGGYTALFQLQERLDSRHEKIQDELEKWEFESSLRKLIIVGFKQKVRELALERAKDEEGSEPTDEEFEAAWEHVLDKPMGEAWPPDELDSPLPISGEGWEVNPVMMRAASEDPRPPTISDLTIQYIPEDTALENEGIDPDSVSRFEIRSFDGDTTWNDALERLGRRFDTYEKQRKRYDRTLKFIEFRSRILKNVLHRFEAYGSVGTLTVEEAEGIVREELPDIFDEGSKPLEYATEIVRKYQRAPSSLPEGSNKMGKFKERWVPDSPGVEGNSKVGMIQREIRKADLYERYNDPESFCELLERLLERHRVA